MVITTLKDGTVIEQDRGSFDDYCVYVTRPGYMRYAPLDTDYFNFFINKSTIYSSQKIYNDFVAIYDQTTKNIDQCVINNTISNIYNSYIKYNRLCC